MPFKPLPYREVKRRLEAAGFWIVSQNGSHVKFAKKRPRERARQSFPVIATWLLEPFEARFVKRESVRRNLRSFSAISYLDNTPEMCEYWMRFWEIGETNGGFVSVTVTFENSFVHVPAFLQPNAPSVPEFPKANGA